MKKLLTIGLVVVFLAGTASATLAPKMELKWSEPGRPYGQQHWTGFGTVDDSTNTVYAGGYGGGGIYVLGTEQVGGTAVIKGSSAPNDAYFPSVVGDYVYYGAGDIYRGDLGFNVWSIRRVDLSDFGNPSASVYAYDYGAVGDAGGGMTTDGTYLYLAHKAGGSTIYNSLNKLDVAATPQGGDAFSLDPLWLPYGPGDVGRGALLSYDAPRDEIWATSPEASYFVADNTAKIDTWHDAGDPTNVPALSPQNRNDFEQWMDGKTGTWYRAGFSKSQRYGDLVFTSGSESWKKGKLMVYPVLKETNYGLYDWDVPKASQPRDEWDLTGDFPNGIKDIAVVGDGTNPTGLWAIGNPVVENEQSMYYLRYYELPEPTTMLVLALGAGLALRRRSR